MPDRSEASAPASAMTAPEFAARRERRRVWGGVVSPKMAPYLFLAPYAVLTLVFFVYPFAEAIKLAFYQTNGPLSRTFVGLQNFRYVLTDPDFHKALVNTSVFAFFSIFLQLPLSLGLALLLNSGKDKLKGMFRLMLFSPHLVGQVFVGIMFAIMFVPQYGLFNIFVHTLVQKGLQMNWLQDPTLVMPALVITALWMYVGFNMIYFLAALQNVDQSLVEAATIDGANAWDRFRHVTLPAIKPVATFVVIMSTIGSFQLFELPFVLLNNSFGPANAGLTIVGYLYNAAFSAGDLGRGASVGWILAIIVFVLSLVQIKLSGTLRKD